MRKNVARRPRFRRVGDLPHVRLTDRDKALFALLARYRFLTTSHIAALLPGSRQNMTRRLQRLYHAGFLDRPKAQLPLRYSGDLRDFAYAATRKGLALLAGGATVSRKGHRPGGSVFLAHALDVSDFLIGVERSSPKHGITFVPEEHLLRKANPGDDGIHLRWHVTVKGGGKTERIGVIPDAVFALEPKAGSASPRRFHFLLESDRGTMPVRRRSLRISSIFRKMLAYQRTRSVQTLHERYGIPGFRVLFITTSTKRMERMKQVWREESGKYDRHLFLFATKSGLAAASDPISHSWQTCDGIQRQLLESGTARHE